MAAGTPLLARVQRWLGEPLTGPPLDAYRDDAAETVRRRLVVLAPLMGLLHVVHVALFWTSSGRRASFAPVVLAWRDALVLAHAAMLPIIVLICLAVFRRRGPRIARLVGPVTAAAYLLHGAACSVIDQLTMTNVTAFNGYCMGIAIILCLSLRASLVVYALAAVAYTVGMLLVQASPEARLSNLLNGSTILAISVALAWLLDRARRREFMQRLTIDRQRGQLSELNAGLERRVQEQVAEIVSRAEEVEHLNAQLRAQVRSRSAELTVALARLAKHRAADDTLRPGTVLAERFEIAEVIGEGGMGIVYAGVDRTTGSRVALKVIQATSSWQLDALRRFLREASAIAAVDHPAVVRVIHVDISEDGLLFQAQELVDGENLELRLADHAALDPGLAARIGAVLFEALAAAHAQGVVHRDVKPSNLMLTHAAPGLKLLDFGIAKLLDDVSRGDGATGRMVLGTPAYMSPEQVSGGEVTDRADVYSAGGILFRMLTGQDVFGDCSAREMMMHHLTTPAPDARTLRPMLPADLAEAALHCLAKEPAARPAALAVARTLTEFADRHQAPALDQLERRPSPAVMRRVDTTVAGRRRT